MPSRISVDQGIEYRPYCAFDDNLNTSRQEDSEGSGAGEDLVLFLDGDYPVDLMGLRPGYTNYYYIKLTSLDVYPGEKWNDTCITEVYAYRADG